MRSSNPFVQKSMHPFDGLLCRVVQIEIVSSIFRHIELVMRRVRKVLFRVGKDPLASSFGTGTEDHILNSYDRHYWSVVPAGRLEKPGSGPQFSGSGGIGVGKVEGCDSRIEVASVPIHQQCSNFFGWEGCVAVWHAGEPGWIVDRGWLPPEVLIHKGEVDMVGKACQHCDVNVIRMKTEELRSDG